jgi:hypothetical protein
VANAQLGRRQLGDGVTVAMGASKRAVLSGAAHTSPLTTPRAVRCRGRILLGARAQLNLVRYESAWSTLGAREHDWQNRPASTCFRRNGEG